jgi:hypothetical protein
MKNVMYYYNSEFGEEVRDPHDAVRNLRIGDVIERWSKRWSILDIRTSQRPNVVHDNDTVSVYLKGPF